MTAPSLSPRRWRITLFGRFRLHPEDSPQSSVSFGPKAASLLAYIAYHSSASGPPRREELAARFWPDAAPEAANNSLRVALTRIQQQTRPLLSIDPTHVGLDLTVCSSDIAEFQEAFAAARRADRDARERTRALEKAAALYSGPLLTDLYDDWIAPERHRFEDACLNALRQLTRSAARERDLGRALDYAERAVRIDPLREASHRSLIALYHRSGRPAAARRQYQEAARLLKEELGTTPSEATKQLVQHLLRDEEPESPKTSVPGRTTLFGRWEDIQALEEMMAQPGRLITLTGPGGTGKTRLAQEVMDRLRPGPEGRAWKVALASLSGSTAVIDAIASVLQIRRAPNPSLPEQVLEFLSGAAAKGPCLLQLDNFEHLLPEESETGETADREESMPSPIAFVQRLREKVPTLSLLVTSRRRLNLSGEQEYPVLPLGVPQISPVPLSPDDLRSYPGIALFVDRARLVRPDFALTRQNAAAITALCRHLEGIPLALELAAPWVQMLTPTQIVARLSRNSALGLDMLSSRQREISPRHRTLMATLDWSYRLLPAALQRFFLALSIFRGGCSLEAAAFLLSEGSENAEQAEVEALRYLQQLREHSLLVAEESATTEDEITMRYRLLEPVRQYADSLLSLHDRQELFGRHARFFLGFTRQQEEKIKGSEQATALAALESEQDNVRAALERSRWSLTQLQIASTLCNFWLIRGRLTEGRRWLAEALESPPSEPALPEEDSLRLYWRAKGLANAGALATTQDDLDTAKALLLEAADLGRRLIEFPYPSGPSALAATLNNLANVERIRGEYAPAMEHWEESLTLLRARDDRRNIATVLGNQGAVMANQGDLPRARALFQESLRITIEDRQPLGASLRISNLGKTFLDEGDIDSAERLFLCTLKPFHSILDYRGMADALLSLGLCAQARGDEQRAARLFAVGREGLAALQVPLSQFFRRALVGDYAYLPRKQADLPPAFPPGMTPDRVPTALAALVQMTQSVLEASPTQMEWWEEAAPFCGA